MTRAELMRHALSQALRRVHIGRKKLKLDEDTRWEIAGEAVEAPRIIQSTSAIVSKYSWRAGHVCLQMRATG